MRTYANNANKAPPNVEASSIGIQNNNILKNRFPSRLAPQNNTKNKITTIQKRGEKIAANPPATAANPVAFCSLMPLKGDQGKSGRNSAKNIAANPLRMFLT